MRTAKRRLSIAKFSSVAGDKPFFVFYLTSGLKASIRTFLSRGEKVPIGLTGRIVIVAFKRDTDTALNYIDRLNLQFGCALKFSAAVLTLSQL